MCRDCCSSPDTVQNECCYSIGTFIIPQDWGEVNPQNDERKKKMKNGKLALSVAELAIELGISKPIAYELIKRDGFPVVRVSPNRVIIPVEGLKAWLREHTGWR